MHAISVNALSLSFLQEFADENNNWIACFSSHEYLVLFWPVLLSFSLCLSSSSSMGLAQHVLQRFMVMPSCNEYQHREGKQERFVVILLKAINFFSHSVSKNLCTVKSKTHLTSLLSTILHHHDHYLFIMRVWQGRDPLVYCRSLKQP